MEFHRASERLELSNVNSIEDPYYCLAFVAVSNIIHVFNFEEFAITFSLLLPNIWTCL